MGQRAGDGVSGRGGSRKAANNDMAIGADDFKAQAARRGTAEPVAVEPEIEAQVEESRDDIERTRAHMEQTLGAIGDRLSPERFKAEAVETAGKLKEDAIETAEHFKEAAVEAARAATHEVISGVKTATREVYDGARNRVLQTKNDIEGAGMTVVDTLRHNPIPTAMVGLGLYWLYQGLEDNKRVSYRRRMRGLTYVGEEREYRTYPVNSMGETRQGYASGRTDASYGVRDRAEDAVGGVRDKVSDVADRVSTGASDVADRVSSKAHDLTESIQESASRLKQRAGRSFENVQDRAHDGLVEVRGMVYTNPLAMAGMAALAGIAMGMMLPDTEIENETLGYTRDRLVNEAQEKVGEIKEKATELKDKAMDVARDTATVAADTITTAVKAADLKEKASDAIRDTAAAATDAVTPTVPLPSVAPITQPMTDKVIKTEVTIEKTVRTPGQFS